MPILLKRITDMCYGILIEEAVLLLTVAKVVLGIKKIMRKAWGDCSE